MLKIFRLHRARCTADRYDRSYTRCHCPIHVEGMLGGRMIREGLNTGNWKRASQVMLEAETRGTWDAPVDDKAAPTIETCISKFLDDLRSRVKPITVRKHEVLLKRERATGKGRFNSDKHSPTLSEFCASVGMVVMKELEPPDAVRQFRQQWKDAPLAATKKLERLRGFFNFCVESGWIATNPAKKIKAPKVDDCPTLPFTEAEIKGIYAALPRLAEQRRKAAHGRALDSDHMDRLAVLIQVMENTGLAITDATGLDATRIVDGAVFLRRMKTGTAVRVPLPPAVLASLQALPFLQDRYYFWSGNGDVQTCSHNYRRTFRALCKLAGIPDGHPHRLRDTFAVRLLLAGVPIDRVSILLGHKSVKVTERHYSPWIQARQQQLEDDVRRLWTTKPKTAMRVIKGGKKSKAASV